MTMLATQLSIWDVPTAGLGFQATYRVSDFDQWRRVARRLLDAEREPEEVVFLDREEWLPAECEDHVENDARWREAMGLREYVVPKGFLTLARTVACHRDATRWALLYRLLWRLTHGEPRLLVIASDEDVARVRRMEKQVMRDAEKLKAGVRFRQVEHGGETWFVAWHRPEHRVLRMAAPFFAERFAAMKWTILTPDESVSWDGGRMDFGAGTSRRTAPSEELLEQLWVSRYPNGAKPNGS